MAHSTLPVSIRPDFPQAFRHFTEQIHRTIESSTCSYETPESIPGACDGGYPCTQPATEFINGQPFCDPHANLTAQADPEVEYALLCRDRDTAAYQVVGAARVALALGRVELIREYLETFELAYQLVEEFHVRNAKKSPESELSNSTQEKTA